MILKSPNSRLGVINLFADYILSKIPKEDKTIIKVVDCTNFILIKGVTTYKTPLDLSEIKNDFIVKFDSLPINNFLKNTIDLIEYDCKLDDVNTIKHTFYSDTDNCSYHKDQIENYLEDPSSSFNYVNFVEKIDDLILVSEFPHGYSMNQGRSLYYYGKYIFYNVPTNYIQSHSTFKVSQEKNEDNDFKFEATINNQEIDYKLTNAVLDLFDFDTTKINNQINEKEWFNEILNPVDDHKILKERVKDFIIF